jgi:hypothetical protein
MCALLVLLAGAGSSISGSLGVAKTHKATLLRGSHCLCGFSFLLSVAQAVKVPNKVAGL